MEGNQITEEVSDYDVLDHCQLLEQTAEEPVSKKCPQLEEMYQNLKAENIRFVGVGNRFRREVRGESGDFPQKSWQKKGNLPEYFSPTRRMHFIRILSQKSWDILPLMLWIRKKHPSGAPIIGNLWKSDGCFYKKRIDTIPVEKKQHNKDISNLFWGISVFVLPWKNVSLWDFYAIKQHIQLKTE